MYSKKGRTAMEPLKLTDNERQILNSYITTVDGLAAYLGESYEIVLHSLESIDHSVIAVRNGFHTGRRVGSPMTDLAISMWEKLTSGEAENEYPVYFTKNKLGEPLKSTTIAIRGENRRIIGMLCINLYLGTPFLHLVSEMLPKENSVFATENFAENPTLPIEQELESARAAVLNNPMILPSMRNKEIIRILQSRHVFEIKNSVEQVANALNISINTVYFHLRNLGKKE